MSQLWYQLKKSPLAIIGIAILALWLFAAIFGPSLIPFTYTEIDSQQIMVNPGVKGHLLGTDNMGRDIFARIVYGSRSIFTVALLTSMLSTLMGVILGFIAGYFGGKIDTVFLRAMDIMMAIPPLVLSMVVLGILGDSNIISLTLIVSIAFVPATARVSRGVLLTEKNKEYVSAARIRGESNLYIMFVEILPNTTGPIIVEATARFAYSIMTVASLGFLGVGLQPPTPDWGMMVIENKPIISQAPWAVLFPALAIASLVIAISIISDFVGKVLVNER
ncbi:MAG: ABC transporter permease [Sphaerochaetaceae bacterium]|jgi:peptide/nickel transport system permease protein|nr:ABC transporter permease [Sphaerochaetaceae bacterium]NLO61330.1 ABC transporter permease [Spirochaetales bacterium]MDD2406694.1 ABC transporter permease [Sphaerochaetaceae bacterium]MDD3670854.1 ABC transporter permease [Sphaerochaetaceae bacterium]MDD4259677.1 ABC transporter permease [Sphaerochaetaceae bacterium]